ncbi:hypothetical protein NHH03_21760 [Stieleria sp. TO1_6]|uniref:hypothetical protein n=1 Tax=Stieleria tagensis TaxID=2956795 RepID=UPI00209A8165|nr:hypothetical protein [Stieleria tagensis]MCO8124381.1 hypothetical protein [Stieleria tagensis]
MNVGQKTLALLLIPFGVMLAQGCSKEKLTQIANSVQQQGEQFVIESKKMTDSLVETPEEPPAETGKITIGTDKPLEIDQAVAIMHDVGDGRQNSLQITSYPPDSQHPSAPAVFLHATTDVQTIALLGGQSIQCNLFIEPKSGAAIARNEIGRPVTVTFGSMNMEQQTITASIEPCVLIGSDNQPMNISGGQILAVVQGN